MSGIAIGGTNHCLCVCAGVDKAMELFAWEQGSFEPLAGIWTTAVMYWIFMLEHFFKWEDDVDFVCVCFEGMCSPTCRIFLKTKRMGWLPYLHGNKHCHVYVCISPLHHHYNIHVFSLRLFNVIWVYPLVEILLLIMTSLNRDTSIMKIPARDLFLLYFITYM